MIKLLQKRGELTAALPTGWTVTQTVFKPGKGVATPPVELMQQALANPVGGKRLEDLVRPGKKIAVIVDDLTRSTPAAQLLPVLLEHLHGLGAAVADIDIVIGTGTHVPLKPEEVERKVGPAVAKTYRIQSHEAKAKDLVVMGELPEYGPVSFNATVAKADVKIILGSILPHVHNGFGGGPKNIMPAVCNFDTIRTHHMRTAIHDKSRLGIVDGNPFLDGVIAIAALARVDYAVQCLFDSLGKISGVLAGPVMDVFRAGIASQTRDLGVEVKTKTDVCVVSSYPYNEGPQVMKSFLPSAMVTKPGGSIIVVTEIDRQFPEFFLNSAREVRGDGTASAEACVIEKLDRCEPLIAGGAMDFNLAIILVFSVSRRFKLTFVGHELLKDAAAAMGYAYQPTLEAAIREEEARRPKATVTVIPGGGYIFPIMDEPYRMLGER